MPTGARRGNLGRSPSAPLHSLLGRVSVTWLIAALGCASPSPPPGWLATLSDGPAPPEQNAFPLPPQEIERLIRRGDPQIESLERTRAGFSGAMRMKARYAGVDRSLRFKWKATPRGGEGWNNTPRREIAAYRVQQWFLDPEDYVVPTTLAVCLPFDRFPEDVEPFSSFDDEPCAFGAQSIWLEGVEVPDRLLDPERFYRDAVYARHLANYNLLTYLISNRDTRRGNQLSLEDPANRRIYSVDNGISFGEWFYNVFRRHWNAIRVPALPRASIERLRRVSRADIEALAVVAQFRPDAQGILREVEPTKPIDPESGVRAEAEVIQIGLRRREIERLHDRLQALLQRVDSGEVPVF